MVPSKHSGSDATEMNIDLSCLDALDDQLLASPIDSFVDLCWAEAVGENDADLGGDSSTLYSAPISAPWKTVFDSKVLDTYYDLDPLDPDSGKWNEDDVPVKAEIKRVRIKIQSWGWGFC